MGKKGGLTAEQKKFYQDNGFVKLTGIFTEEETQRISDDYNKLFSDKGHEDMNSAWHSDDMTKLAKTKDFEVKSIHDLQYHSDTFSHLVLFNQNLLDCLEDIMGPDILLHHTKAHWKPARNGAPYLMHQDYQYFPFKKHSMTAVFLHVDDSTPENGGLCVYPGSHKLGPLKDHGGRNKEYNETYHYADPNVYTLEKATPVEAKRGDIVIFSYLLLHGSYSNLSDRPRRMFLVQLMAADDEPIESTHQSPGQGLVLRGKNLSRRATRYKSNNYAH